MKLNILLLSIIILTAGIWTYFDDIKKTPNQIKPAYADFDLIKLDGSTTSLHAHKSKIIFVHFWATWCAPCVTELPKLMKLSANKNNDIVILAIAVADDKNKINNFLQKINKPLPNNFIIGLDPDKKISKEIFSTIKLPETYVLRQNLALYDKVIGADEAWDSHKWYQKIDSLL